MGYHYDEKCRNARYKKWRRRIFAKNPLCVKCKERGLTVSGTDLDHIVPLVKAPERVMDEENVQVLCKECHQAKTAQENRQEGQRILGYDESGYPIINPSYSKG